MRLRHALLRDIARVGAALRERLLEARVELARLAVVGSGVANDGERAFRLVPSVAAGVAARDVLVQALFGGTVDDLGETFGHLGAFLGNGVFHVHSFTSSRRRASARDTRLPAAASSMPQASPTSR